MRWAIAIGVVVLSALMGALFTMAQAASKTAQDAEAAAKAAQVAVESQATAQLKLDTEKDRWRTGVDKELERARAERQQILSVVQRLDGS